MTQGGNARRAACCGLPREIALLRSARKHADGARECAPASREIAMRCIAGGMHIEDVRDCKRLCLLRECMPAACENARQAVRNCSASPNGIAKAEPLQVRAAGTNKGALRQNKNRDAIF